MSATTVHPGQTWESTDPREHGTRLVIESVDDTHATVRRGTRTTRIRLDRMKPGSTGYRLVEEA